MTLPWVRSLAVVASVLLLAACSDDVSLDEGPGPGPKPRVPANRGSTELIDEARRAGKLDEKTAALYELYARFAPSQLPDAYFGAPPDDGAVLAAVIVNAHLDEYSEAERQAARAILVSPLDPSWMRFPAGSGFGAGATGPSCYEQVQPTLQYALPIDVGSSTRYRFFPAGMDANEANAVRSELLQSLGEPVVNVGAVTGAFTLGEYLDAVHDHYVSTVGLTDPVVAALPSITAAQTVGSGDARIPVMVFQCPNGRQEAYAFPNGHISVTLDLAFRDDALRRAILPHELFHLFQFASTPLTTSPQNDSGWPYEASALYAEDTVASDVQRWHLAPPATTLAPLLYSPLNRSFRCTEEPFHSTRSGVCTAGGRNELLDRGDYSKFVWFKYAAARSQSEPASVLRSFWQSYMGSAAAAFDSLGWSDWLLDFQLALVADVAGAVTFSPADRASFADLDLPAEDPARYTFHVQAAAFDSPVSWRIAPTQEIADHLPRHLTTDDVNSLEPGGTHRWLIEVPSAAMAPTPFELDAVFLSPDNDGFKLVIAPYEGASIDLAAGATSNTLDRVAVTAPSPRYVGLLTSSPSADPIDYKGGLTLLGACVDDCVKYYAQAIGSQTCCEKRFASLQSSDPALYAQSVLSCNADAKKCSKPLCEYMCDARKTAYPEPTSASQRDLGELICTAAGVDRYTPSGHVPIHAWPTTFNCDEMHACSAGLEVDKPALILEGGSDSVTITVGKGNPLVPQAGVAVSVSATGGSVTPAGGTTGPDGKLTVNVSVPAGGSAKTVELTISASSTTLEQSIPIGVPGLRAQYSTGADLREGPIFHGYWSSCNSTGKNYYQGACTPTSSSPVDWAWAESFSVSWTGFLAVPTAASYYFSSSYWVDGTVYIKVHDTVIADFDTNGGGYSGTAVLPKGWVPVSMSFKANGGTNNMHLGWTPPGATAWEAVPLANLASAK